MTRSTKTFRATIAHYAMKGWIVVQTMEEMVVLRKKNQQILVYSNGFASEPRFLLK